MGAIIHGLKSFGTYQKPLRGGSGNIELNAAATVRAVCFGNLRVRRKTGVL